RDAGDADAVVGRLRDRAGDVGAVAVIVVGMLGIVHEVIALGEPGLGQIRNLVEALPVLVGDAGVDDRDHDAVAVGDLPGVGHADLDEVPLVLVLRVVRVAFPLGVIIHERGDARRAVDDRIGGVGLGDLDVGERGEPGQHIVAAGRVDMGAVEALVYGLV